MKKNIIKAAGVVLTAVLITSQIIPVCANNIAPGNKDKLMQEINNNKAVVTEDADKSENAKDTADKGSTNSGSVIKKNETVYVKADANGNTDEIKVTNYLKIPENVKEIKDYSRLSEIENTEGDETFTQKGNGEIIWENLGEDITYEGIGKEELPVSVKVTYYLNDKEIAPDKLAGQSGRVKIRFDYENHTAGKAVVNGSEVDSIVPFMMASLLYLPSENFSNVVSEDGNVIESTEQTIVVGMAFPGIEECLKLKDYEPTEDIELKDYFEVTADAVDFKLDFTATVATVGILDDFDTADLNDIDDMIDDMDDMKDGVGELTDGVGELLDGVKEIRDYVNAYMSGVAAVDEGVGKLKDGAYALSSQNENLKSGAKAVSDGLEQINTMLSQVSVGQSDESSKAFEALGNAATSLNKDAAELDGKLSEASASIDAVKAKLDLLDTNLFNDNARSKAKDAIAQAVAESGLDEAVAAQVIANASARIDATDFCGSILSEVPAVNIDKTAIDALIADMTVQLKTIEGVSGGLSASAGSMKGLNESLTQLKTGIGALTEGSKKLTEGIGAYTDGVGALYEGVTKLKDGTWQLASVGGEFNDGFDELVDGVTELYDGVKEFNDEGVSELSDLAGDKLKSIVDGVRGLKKLNDEYNNYSGIADGMEGSVVFIFETGKIE